MRAWLPYGLAGLWDRLRLRRTMDALSAMLEEALAGHFDASHYDESRLSALEHQMARYLATSDLSNRNLRRARERVEQMVADISHQTKTPIANLLLYAGLLQEQELPPLCRDYVETLAGQAEKLRFLIDALVKAGRLESGIIQQKGWPLWWSPPGSGPAMTPNGRGRPCITWWTTPSNTRRRAGR